MNNDIFKELEPNAEVPAYLKNALVSEIDLIRDTIQIVELFTESLFSTALLCVSDSESPSQP
ncbi:hypothetical protein [Persicitalea jodogahamensis]|uniref:Uncharacterized protein n=1 Tax=Persicitalea jodogahamensis TaxID=402147 RepID=A0A8J3D9R6_9BACT|nr:hypothetical protein [Persicitalea jodogahamensis]GHB71372.1 hypothetical protein GCM10007390_26480 [Persicitalea jodogahamensis]